MFRTLIGWLLRWVYRKEIRQAEQAARVGYAVQLAKAFYDLSPCHRTRSLQFLRQHDQRWAEIVVTLMQTWQSAAEARLLLQMSEAATSLSGVTIEPTPQGVARSRWVPAASFDEVGCRSPPDALQRFAQRHASSKFQELYRAAKAGLPLLEPAELPSAVPPFSRIDCSRDAENRTMALLRRLPPFESPLTCCETP